MSTIYRSEDKLFDDFLDFEGIDFYQVNFSGDDIIKKDYYFVIKEVWKGEITSTDTIINSSKNNYLKMIDSKNFSFRIIVKKIDETKSKFYIKGEGFSTTKIYKTVKSNDYSLRDIGTTLSIQPNTSFFAFAYILPYEKGDYKYWCAVETSGKDVESWGKEFELEHYIILEMKFFNLQ